MKTRDVKSNQELGFLCSVRQVDVVIPHSAHVPAHGTTSTQASDSHYSQAFPVFADFQIVDGRRSSSTQYASPEKRLAMIKYAVPKLQIACPYRLPTIVLPGRRGLVLFR